MFGPIDSEKKYDILPFRVEKLNDKYFVSTDFGGWSLLTEEEFRLLKSYKVHTNPDLFEKLKKAGIIAVEGEEKNILNLVRKKWWYLNNGTSLHVVAVTTRCNFACKYCYANAKDVMDMSKETAEKVVDFIMQSPAKVIVIEFSGGEPLLNFDAIKTIVKRAEKKAKEKKKEIKFAIVHNGTLWDEEKMNFVMKHKIGICFSLDGPRDLHNLHRVYFDGRGTYDDVVRWIAEFRKRGYPSLSAIPVITRFSLPRWKDIVDEYLRRGFRNIRFKYLSYFGRAAERWNEIGYGVEEFLSVWKKVIEYIFELNNRGIFITEDIARIMAGKLFNFEDPGYCELQMPCGAGISQLAYAPDGSIYTCDEGRMFEDFKLGNVNMKWKEVLNSPVLKSMVLASSRYFDISDFDAFSPFSGICPLEAYNMRGTVLGQLPLNRRWKIHKEMLRYIVMRADRDERFREMLMRWAKERAEPVYAIGSFV